MITFFLLLFLCFAYHFSHVGVTMSLEDDTTQYDLWSNLACYFMAIVLVAMLAFNPR